mgnify:CR=1 FL=1
MIVDAHQHFWSLARDDYGWLQPELTPLYRDFLPCDLEPLLRRSGISKTVLVQAAPTEAETEFMLELAFANPFIGAVVGWADMERPDFSRRLARLIDLGRGCLKGIRPMVQDIPDPAWLAAPQLDASFQVLAESGLAFDALVRPVHLPFLAERLRRTPSLRVVIDHAAKPAIADGQFDDWRRALGKLAAESSVACKLSGLLTEAGAGWRSETIRPYIETILGHFGPERVLWGSDWPVLELAADYESWLELTMEALSGLTAHDRSAVMGGNAWRFYQIDGEQLP